MNAQIKSELVQLVDDWRNGKQIRSVKVGHDEWAQQQRIHECVVFIVSAGLGADLTEEFTLFQDVAEEAGRRFQLSADDAQAAASLAWKALTVGWVRAVSGFGPDRFLLVERAAEA